MTDQLTFGDAPVIPDEELANIERMHEKAFETRSLDPLPGVIGFGEIGVVLKWPLENASIALKRLAPASDQAGADHQIERIFRAANILAPTIAIAPTRAQFTPTRSGGVATYLVQPLYPKETLADTILEESTPDPEHPLVQAVCDAILQTVDRGAVLDSQYSNFSFGDDGLILFDNGSAILVDSNGKADTDFGVVLDPVPGFLRSVARKQVGAISERLAGTRGNMAHSALSLVRVGQTRWLGPVLEVYNQHLEDPLTEAEVTEEANALHKQLKSVKRLGKTQRFWTQKVRRQHYDLFITDSFTGEIV